MPNAYGDLLQLVNSRRLQPSKLIGEEVALKDVQSCRREATLKARMERNIEAS